MSIVVSGLNSVQRVYGERGLGGVVSQTAMRARDFAIERWRSLRRHVVMVGDAPITLRVTPETSSLVEWRPNWKTHAISRMLASRPGAFMDVGANIGQTLLDYCSAPTKRGYFGFEPATKCIDQLKRVIGDNGLGSCTIVPVALSDQNAVAKFHRHSSTDSAATLVEDLRPARRTEAELVPCYRFDDIRGTLGLSGQIGVIKIDVEGAELYTIKGMSATIRSDAPWILCEVLDRDPKANAEQHNSKCSELFSLLQFLGYIVLRINKTPDGQSVAGLTEITSFPTAAFSEATREACDYLFVPRDQHGLVGAVMAP